MDLPNSKRGAYDYFIMDYQQNVRMILTEEAHTASNTATMETSRATLEESIFGQAGNGNEVAATRTTTPQDWTNNTSAMVSRVGLNNSRHCIGPNTLQKVMAGDKISAVVDYFHDGGSPGSYYNDMLSQILGSLTQTISTGGVAGNLVKDNAAQITNQLSGVSGFVNAVNPNGTSPGTKAYEAYLTILFFDERFNFIKAEDGGVQQVQVEKDAGSGAVMSLTDISAPKNGYAFIYVSNQSDLDVYFDNLQVGIVQGNIAEENHYYAYGLKIATLSSKKLGDSYEGSLKNNYLYQGAFSELDDDIGWTDFALRNYDAQIGRWVQQDPYQEYASGYLSMGDDPVNLIDPSGGFTLGGLTKAGTVAVMTIGGAIIGTVVGLVSGDDDFTGTLIGAGAGLAAGLGSLIQQITVSMGIHVMNTAVTIINSSVTTEQAGKQANGSNSIKDAAQGRGPDKGQIDDSPRPVSQPELNYPVFEAENRYPDIQRIDLLYWLIAPPEQKIIKDNRIFLLFQYEPNVEMQRENTRLAQKLNRDCYKNKTAVQQCHEVPYASTMQGGTTSLMMPSDAGQNGGHGGSLKWFYIKNNMKPGDFFLVPVGENPKEPRRIPAPVLVPKIEPKASPAHPKYEPPKYPGEVWPILIPVFWQLVEEYGWWLILAL